MARDRNKSVTAAIYQTATGHELRVHYGADVDNLLDSLLVPVHRPGAPANEAALIARAEALRITLEEQGWRPADAS